MRSRSSRRKSDSNVPREHIVRLMQDGALLGTLSDGLLDAVERLRVLGVIETDSRVYVKCANPEDSDFPPRNRDCRGRVYIPDERLWDSGGELRCPECERSVFPDQYRKRRFSELRVHVLCDGVMTFLTGLLAELDSGVRQSGEGVLNLKVGDDAAMVCVVDYCQDPKALSRDRASHCPTCYVVVNARDFEARFLKEDWVHRVLLADLISGTTNLANLVRSAVQQGEPPTLRHVSVPVCDKRHSPW